MRSCEDVKMCSRPGLLEEPFARTFSGKKENKSLRRRVWRWREVWAGDTSRKRECVFWLAGMKGFIPIRARWADRIPNFLRAVHGIDARGTTHRFGCDKQRAPISPYLCLAKGHAATSIAHLHCKKFEAVHGCTKKGSAWWRDAGLQYNISLSMRFVAKNVPFKNITVRHAAAAFRFFLQKPKTPTADETGCAMVFLLP